MKIATRSGPVGVTFALLMCAGLAAPLTGCNLFRKKSSSATKAGAVGPKRLEAVIAGEYGESIDATVDSENYLLSFSFANPLFVSGLANVDVSFYVDDSSLFEVTQFAVPMGITIRHADGSVETKTSALPLLSDKRGLMARGVFKVRAGDVLEITVNDIPDVLQSSSLYASVSPVSDKDESDGDSLDPRGGYWNARKAASATSAEEIVKRILKLADKGLFTFDSYVTTLKPSSSLMARVDEVDPCLEEPGSTGSGSVSSTLDAKPWSVPLMKSESRSGRGAATDDVCQGFNGSVTVESDAAAVTFESKASGLISNETYVTFTQNASKESDYAALKLGSVEASLGSPSDHESATNAGRYEKQKVSFLVKGVTQESGLKLRLNGTFLYPMNIPEVANSSFDGTGLGASLYYASGPNSGKPVTDSTGVALEVFKVEEVGTSNVRRYLSFVEARLPDLADGDYEVTVDFPSKFPAGAYVNMTLVANRLVEMAEVLDPAIIADFKARDAATGAVVHDWPRADYTTAFNPPKRERIAMVAVAKAMEEIRDAMHLAVNRTNPWTGAKPAPSALNVIDRSTADTCLGANQAPHWSDLTLHYYCQLNEARACYTDGIRAIAGYMQKVQAEETAKGGGEAAIKGAIACRLPSMKVGPVTLPVLTFDPNYKNPTLRQYIFNQCATAPSAAMDSTAVPANAIPGCLARTDIEAYAPGADGREFFSWLTKDPERAKVFRYIMEAPTYAFDEKDQQDLINAFYRVTKPADPSDCAKRARRAIDMIPDVGKPSVCEVGHDQVPLRAPAGR